MMVNCSPSGTLKIHTNAHAVRGRPTLKDVERQFRNGSFRELKSKKNSKETQMNSNVLKCNSEDITAYLKEQKNTNSLANRYPCDNHSEDETHISLYKETKEIANKVDAILDSSKEKHAFIHRRNFETGLNKTTRISFLCIILLFCCLMLNTFLKGLSFVQIFMIASVLVAAVVLHQFIISTETMLTSV